VATRLRQPAIGEHGPRILFRVAAGPRIGAGHLVRALRLAALVRIPAALSLRGNGTLRVPLRPDVIALDTRGVRATIDAVRPTLLVIDDPCEEAGRPWLVEARRRRVPVVGILDAGIGLRAGDLAIDGSVARAVRPDLTSCVARGPAFAVVDPLIGRHRARRGPVVPASRGHVFISLGGGYRTAYARRVARALSRAAGETPVLVAGGFSGRAGTAGDHRIHWLGPQPTIVPWLAASAVAVVAGGVTLYEACALGVPTVAVPIVSPQRPAVAAMARRGAVVALAGSGERLPRPEAVASNVLRLLQHRAVRRSLSCRGPAIVDGEGSRRVAGALRRLARGAGVGDVLAGLRDSEG
jgi:spore coat polysaccharide biosynthesis predicted glycosyltransferase SpsG